MCWFSVTSFIPIAFLRLPLKKHLAHVHKISDGDKFRKTFGEYLHSGKFVWPDAEANSFENHIKLRKFRGMEQKTEQQINVVIKEEINDICAASNLSAENITTAGILSQSEVSNNKSKLSVYYVIVFYELLKALFHNYSSISSNYLFLYYPYSFFSILLHTTYNWTKKNLQIVFLNFRVRLVFDDDLYLNEYRNR